MISEALLRGDNVYNVALRIDPNSAMRAAAFQLVRNVLHACGTVIALRPEDNLAAASVEIVEAAVASPHPIEHVSHRCQIPSVVSDVRIEPADHADSAEHELLGDILEAQAAQIAAKPHDSAEPLCGQKFCGLFRGRGSCGEHRCALTPRASMP